MDAIAVEVAVDVDEVESRKDLFEEEDGFGEMGFDEVGVTSWLERLTVTILLVAFDVCGRAGRAAGQF